MEILILTCIDDPIPVGFSKKIQDRHCSLFPAGFWSRMTIPFMDMDSLWVMDPDLENQYRKSSINPVLSKGSFATSLKFMVNIILRCWLKNMSKVWGDSMCLPRYLAMGCREYQGIILVFVQVGGVMGLFAKPVPWSHGKVSQAATLGFPMFVGYCR